MILLNLITSHRTLREIMTDPLILDTNVFSRKDFLNWLDTYHDKKKLPAIAYAEICVDRINQDKIGQFKNLLNKLNINVERLDSRIAEHGAIWGSRGKDFSDKARDYLIGAHAHTPPLVLVTDNKDDFWFLEDRVLTPGECMRKF